MKHRGYWLQLLEGESLFLKYWEDNYDDIIAKKTCKDLLDVHEHQLKDAADIFKTMLEYDCVECEYRDRVTLMYEQATKAIQSINGRKVRKDSKINREWLHLNITDSQFFLTQQIKKFLEVSA